MAIYISQSYIFAPVNRRVAYCIAAEANKPWRHSAGNTVYTLDGAHHFAIPRALVYTVLWGCPT